MDRKKVNRTIKNNEGKIILYSIEQFIKDIGEKDNCFICGAEKNSKIFNDEHVIPNWLLKNCNLHGKTITLPNGYFFQYGKYTISCCEECNSELGEKVENPISRLLTLPYEDIISEIRKNQDLLFLIFQWLNLLFLKTALRDKTFNFFPDVRKGKKKISEIYDWETLHHIHCICRAHFVKSKVDSNVLGSLLILPAMIEPIFGKFDFADNQLSGSIMIRINDFFIIGILNDSCKSQMIFKHMIEKINGPLTRPQIRELFAHLTFINIHLKERPLYYSHVNTFGENHNIKAKTFENYEIVPEEEYLITWSELNYHYNKDTFLGTDIDENILLEIKNGKRSFLFSGKDKFNNLNE